MRDLQNDLQQIELAELRHPDDLLFLSMAKYYIAKSLVVENRVEELESAFKVVTKKINCPLMDDDNHLMAIEYCDGKFEKKKNKCNDTDCWIELAKRKGR
jgi:hypothetical protein